MFAADSGRRNLPTGWRAAALCSAVVLAALLCWLPAAQAQSGGPLVALADDDGGETDSFYQLALGDGAVSIYEVLRRDPLRLRRRPLSQNLFDEIGRPKTQAAGAGEILLAPIHSSTGAVRAALFVETSTGYVAFFDQLGKGTALGRISTAIGRPFGPLAAADGNFVLLPHRERSGRTEGAYLYHAGSGRGFYYSGLAKLEADSRPASTSPLPKLTGRAAAAPLLDRDRATTGYLVADSGNGDLHFLIVNRQLTEQLASRKSPLNLFEVLPTEVSRPTLERFVAVPIEGPDDRTVHVLFVDVGSGDMVLFENVGSRSAQRLSKLAPNLYDVLDGADSTVPRTVAAIPRHSSGDETLGIWLLDSLTRGVVYVNRPALPRGAVLSRVSVNGR